MTINSCNSCDRVPPQEQRPERLPWLSYNKLETVCRVALGIFAAITAPVPCAIAFASGTATGLACHAWSCYSGETLLTGGGRPVCAQGYSEMLSGWRLPERVNLVVTALFVAMHTHHMPHFFVPFTGVFIGLGVSTVLADAIATGFARWQERDVPSGQYVSPAAASCCH